MGISTLSQYHETPSQRAEIAKWTERAERAKAEALDEYNARVVSIEQRLAREVARIRAGGSSPLEPEELPPTKRESSKPPPSPEPPHAPAEREAPPAPPVAPPKPPEVRRAGDQREPEQSEPCARQLAEPCELRRGRLGRHRRRRAERLDVSVFAFDVAAHDVGSIKTSRCAATLTSGSPTLRRSTVVPSQSAPASIASAMRRSVDAK